MQLPLFLGDAILQLETARVYAAKYCLGWKIGEIISRRMQMGSGEERRPLCVSELSAFEARGGEGKKKREMSGESIGIKELLSL